MLVGDNFLPELHLRQPGFTYNACGPFTKHRERIQKFRETGDLRHIYKDELDETCFAHDAADSKCLAKRTISDKILTDRAYEIAINPQYSGYQRELASMMYVFFDKKTQLGASVNDLSKMRSLSSFNHGVKYSLCVIYVFTKHAWIKPIYFFWIKSYML